MEAKDFAVIGLTDLKWPASLRMPSKRFRLFVAADISDLSASTVADFALAALCSGMVYFCAWGRDCEKFHDIVDEVIAKDDTAERRFTGPTVDDVVMTTWHENQSLEEALDFFATCTVPTDGFMPDSSFRLAICVGNLAWAATVKQFLESAEFFV
jgi:hypothetical protein